MLMLVLQIYLCNILKSIQMQIIKLSKECFVELAIFICLTIIKKLKNEFNPEKNQSLLLLDEIFIIKKIILLQMRKSRNEENYMRKDKIIKTYMKCLIKEQLLVLSKICYAERAIKIYHIIQKNNKNELINNPVSTISGSGEQNYYWYVARNGFSRNKSAGKIQSGLIEI